MKTFFFSLLISILFINTACFSQQTQDTRIAWDSWGVPHIYAKTTDNLFFAQGWAQMHNHANMVLQLYGSSRGKGAEYWGKKQSR